ncbi:MAG TPA: hypothetical protein V6C76_13440 [Drouetiella sp.]
MDQDVNKAIKQLETIAIKAMKSGYLDDAAKVMHIAEEIERVDKSGLVPESPDEAGLVSESAAAQPPEPMPSEIDEAPVDSKNVVALNKFRMKRPSQPQPPQQKDSPSSQY